MWDQAASLQIHQKEMALVIFVMLMVAVIFEYPPIPPRPHTHAHQEQKKVCFLNNRTDGVADSRPSVQMVRIHQRSLFRSDQIKFV